MPPARSRIVFMSVLGWWYSYGAPCLFYVSTPPVFSYSAGIYNNCCDDKRHVEIISKTRSALFLTIGSFFAFGWNGNL